MYTTLSEDIPKLHIFVYIGTALVLSLFCVIDLSLNEWFKYCYFSIGLVYGSSSLDGYGNENSIPDIRDDFCNGGLVEKNIDYFCPSFCTNSKNFATAGGMLIAFSIFTLAGFAILILMHSLLLCRKKANFRFAWLFMLVPLLTYMAGFIIYCAIANVGGLKGVRKNKNGANPVNFEWKGGMVFTVIIIIFMAANLVHGILFTRKHLLVDGQGSSSGMRYTSTPLE